MKDCRRLFARLSQYLDAELPEPDCAAIQAHLSDCPPCRAFLRTLRKTVDLCRQYSPETMPPPLKVKARKELLDAYNRAAKKLPSRRRR